MGEAISMAEWQASVVYVEERERARRVLELSGYTDLDLDHLPKFSDEDYERMVIVARIHGLSK